MLTNHPLAVHKMPPSRTGEGHWGRERGRQVLFTATTPLRIGAEPTLSHQIIRAHYLGPCRPAMSESPQALHTSLYRPKRRAPRTTRCTKNMAGNKDSNGDAALHGGTKAHGSAHAPQGTCCALSDEKTSTHPHLVAAPSASHAQQGGHQSSSHAHTCHPCTQNPPRSSCYG